MCDLWSNREPVSLVEQIVSKSIQGKTWQSLAIIAVFIVKILNIFYLDFQSAKLQIPAGSFLI